MYLQASRIVETLALQAAFYIACLTSSCLEVLFTTSCHHTFLCAESVNKGCHREVKRETYVYVHNLFTSTLIVSECDERRLDMSTLHLDHNEREHDSM